MNKTTKENLKTNESYFQFVIFGRANEKHRFDLEMTLFGIRRTLEKDFNTKYVYFKQVYSATVPESMLNKGIEISNLTINDRRIVTIFIFINTVPNMKFLESVNKDPYTTTIIVGKENEYKQLKEKICTRENITEYLDQGPVLYCKIENEEYFSDEAINFFAEGTDNYKHFIGITRSPYNFFKLINESKEVEYSEI